MQLRPAVKAAWRVRGPCAKVWCRRCPDHQESPAIGCFSFPLLGLAPSGVKAMQKLRLSPGTMQSQRRDLLPKVRPLHTQSASHQQLQKTPRPIGSRDTPQATSSASSGVNWLILGRDRAASSLLPTPSQRGHLAPPRAPLPQLASPLYRQDPTSVKHHHPLASIIIGEKK